MTTTDTSRKEITIPACPACSHTRGRNYGEQDANGARVISFVYVCGACNGVFSNHINLGDSYSIVLPQMVADEAAVAQENLRYFDFSGVSSKGTYRRHGWFDTASKRIVQVG